MIEETRDSVSTRPMPAPSIDLSRRRLIRSALWTGLGLGAALPVLAGNIAEAQKKVAKAAAKYQTSPNAGHSCSQCNYFLAPNSCKLVAGNISPNGWCELWTKKPA